MLAPGSQFLLGAHDGDPVVRVRGAAAGYVLMTGDSTNLYNYDDGEGTTARDVTHASRSLLWLQPDDVVVFDRASTAVDGRFKRFWLTLPSAGAAPVLADATVVASTPGGQRLHVASLLPQAASRAIVGPAIDAPDSFWQASLDPMSADEANGTGAYRLRVEATGHPRSTTFLHVLQGAHRGATPAAAALVRSDQGSAMSGACVGSTAIVFPDDLYAATASTSFVVPAACTRVLVTELAAGAGAGYTVQRADVATGRRITLSAGGRAAGECAGGRRIELGVTSPT
jgi:hypothetical protein